MEEIRRTSETFTETIEMAAFQLLKFYDNGLFRNLMEIKRNGSGIEIKREPKMRTLK